MNARFLLATCLTFALAAPAFAQDAASAAASGTADAPATDAPAAAASDAAKPAKKHHAKKHHAHAAGDPMHIDHSADHAPVPNPTESKVTVPASGQ